LKERDISIVENAQIEASTIETPAPTPAPTFENAPINAATVGTVTTLSQSSSTGTVLAVVFSLIVLCSTLAMYFYYVRVVKFNPPKDDFSYSYDDSAIEPSLLSEDDVYDRKMSMKSLTSSVLDDEPYDDEYATSTTRSSGESPMLDTKSKNRLQAFERRLQSSALSGEFSGQVSENQRRMNRSLEAFDDRIQRRQDELNASQTSKSSFEDRIRKKMSQENGSLHKSSDSVGSFDERLKAKLAGDGRNRDSNLHRSTESMDSFDMRLQAKIAGDKGRTHHRSSDSVDSFDERLRAKIARDDPTSKSDAGFRRIESTEILSSFDERLKAKLGRAKIPLDVSFSNEIKSSGSVTSVDSFEDRIERKLGSASGHGSNAQKVGARMSSSAIEDKVQKKLAQNEVPQQVQLKHSASMSSVDSFEDRIRQKLAREGAASSAPSDASDSRVNVQRMTSSRAMEDRINQKLAKNNSTRGSMSSVDSFEERIQKKLNQNSGAVPSSIAGERGAGMQRMTSANAMDRIQSKIAQNDNAVPSRKLKSARSVSSMDSYEERIRQKLAKANADDQKPGAQSVTSTFESRISQKMSQDRASGSKQVMNSSSASVSSVSSFEDRIQQKLAQNSAAGTTPSIAVAQKSGLQSIAPGSFESRIAQKMSQDRATGSKHERSSSTASVSSIGSFEDRIQQKLARNSAAGTTPSIAVAQKPGVQSIAPGLFESRIAQKMTQDRATGSKHERSSSNASVSSIGSFEDRIQKKLSQEGSAATTRPTTQKQSSMDSFEGRIQQKMGGNDAKYQRMSSVDTMDALKSNIYRRQKTSDSSQSNDFESRIQRKLQQSSNASVGSDSASYPSRKSPEDSPNADDSMSEADTSFKRTLKSQLAEAKKGTGSQIDASSTAPSFFDDTLSLDERIKIKQAKFGEKRGRRKHKSKKAAD
jgi:hypothetical protein